MGLEGLIILLVVLVIVFGWYGNGRWYNTPAGTPVAGGGIIGLLVTILIAIIIVVLIFMVLGGGFHITMR